MAENFTVTDLNLPESSRSRLQEVPGVQGNGGRKISRCKSCCSRTCVALSITAIVLLLLIVVCRILMCCPPQWEKHGKKCYFFSSAKKEKGWNAFRKECTDMDSDLVIIADEKELHYLTDRSKANFYFLGLRYSESEQKWKWINNVEHSTNMFNISGQLLDYLCTAIGYGQVVRAHCDGDPVTKNMCEKVATIYERQKES
ncbi:PREDICTED: C-type lectin domain family 5 member A-like [Acanthisitta chloris]|uniref:C-type lectin domain family 5 member A-like n=1 Tax=Acanthisitta chloris TaxID=57068 RepID=UPI0004F0DA26|nr:PREDICTED: C-type lectin domain family 5 member A-like [Acanthisitta chloris]